MNHQIKHRYQLSRRSDDPAPAMTDRLALSISELSKTLICLDNITHNPIASPWSRDQAAHAKSCLHAALYHLRTEHHLRHMVRHEPTHEAGYEVDAAGTYKG